MKKIIVMLLIVVMIATFIGCDRQATKVSYNISKEADNFNICREIIVINVRDGSVLYTLKGFFSLQDEGHNELVVISEIGNNRYKKDFIHLNDYVTYVCTDLTGAAVDKYHYELNILPQMIGEITFTSND